MHFQWRVLTQPPNHSLGQSPKHIWTPSIKGILSFSPVLLEMVLHLYNYAFFVYVKSSINSFICVKSSINSNNITKYITVGFQAIWFTQRVERFYCHDQRIYNTWLASICSTWLPAPLSSFVFTWPIHKVETVVCMEKKEYAQNAIQQCSIITLHCMFTTKLMTLDPHSSTF